MDDTVGAPGVVGCGHELRRGGLWYLRCLGKYMGRYIKSWIQGIYIYIPPDSIYPQKTGIFIYPALIGGFRRVFPAKITNWGLKKLANVF